MTITMTDLMQHISDLFTGIYAAAGGSGPSLAFEKLGVPVPEAMFKLAETDSTLSPALAIERLSAIAAAVLERQGDSLYRSSRTVEAVTALMLQQAMPSSSEAMTALGSARSADAQRFEVTRGSLDGVFQFHPVYATPTDWYEPTAASWTPHGVGKPTGPSPPPGGKLRQNWLPPHPVQITPPAWQVLPSEMRPALEARSAGAHPLLTMARMRPDVVSMSTPASREILQTAFASGETIEAPIAQPRSRIVATTSTTLDRPLLLAHAAAQVSASATPQNITTDSVDINFEHCVVTLNRPWFPQTFTMLRNWYLPGYARGEISSGTGDGDTGLMPVLASGFVAVRKLNITARWTQADLAVIRGAAGFGPFCLVGRSFDETSGALSAAGMQIIGWFCEALPVLPPLSDPALSLPAAPSPAELCSL
jgi:hypothetical protein